MCGAASLKRKPSRSDISGRAGQPEQPDTDSAFQRTDRDIDRLNTAPSLFQIIRDDCRLRLYVPPLQWTSVHLEVLGHQFVYKTEIPHKGCKPRVFLKFHEHDAELPAEEIAKFLRRTSASVTRSLLLRELVARLGLRLQELSGNRLPFCFHDNPVDMLHVDGLLGAHHHNRQWPASSTKGST
ncbi:hypothetical protein NKR19_g3423 [Coniochaeta hoffmannii]|uniref:Uncharacterized protein n=1 Tax=Coniochaeta hoffmannii TaxID=91930 RepID=A0AA38S8Q7_9PEZI|nr:hypothetical protein NKR19_g3423 [Coniochaeta hoffmannii]